MALRLVLFVLGLVVSTASRLSSRFRAQLTRDLVIEVASDDGVARHFVFRGRRASSGSGRAADAECRLLFATANQGYRAMVGPRAGHELLDGVFDGSIRVEGNAALMPWFQGLLPAALPWLPVLTLPNKPPSPYVRHAPNNRIAQRILREPASDALDPGWTAAATARDKLLMMRIARGERPEPF